MIGSRNQVEFVCGMHKMTPAGDNAGSPPGSITLHLDTSSSAQPLPDDEDVTVSYQASIRVAQSRADILCQALTLI